MRYPLKTTSSTTGPSITAKANRPHAGRIVARCESEARWGRPHPHAAETSLGVMVHTATEAASGHPCGLYVNAG